MTLSPILSSHDADTIALDFGVFLAEQGRAYRVSQPAIIAALRPIITPSQPETVPHAPVAQTDGEGLSSSQPTSSSVAPVSGSGEAEPGIELPGQGNAPGSKSVTLRSDAPGDLLPAPDGPETDRAKVLAVHAEHPDWPSKLIAQHIGISEDSVRATASRKGIKLVSWWDYQRGLKAKTTAALKTVPAKQPAETDATGILHRTQRAPQGRFYLRERIAVGVEARYVHQSLSPCPTGSGPLMTADRDYAWLDTIERYRGAVKKWPELATMRKVGAEK